MATKKRIIYNTISGIWTKVSGSLLRFIQIPVFITSLGVEKYGYWVLISSIPTWLLLTNFGFGNVASNEISLLIANDKHNEVDKIYSTTVVVTIAIALLGSISSCIISSLLNWNLIMNIDGNIQHGINYLMVSVFLLFINDIFLCKYRAMKLFHKWMLISSIRPWIEFSCVYYILQQTKSLDKVALAVLISNILYLIINFILSAFIKTKIKFSYRDFSIMYMKKLILNGIAYQTLPLSNAIVFQGSILIVQHLLGPVNVVIYSTLRIIVRSINQIIELVNQIIMPELSYMLGANSMKKAARLHALGLIAVTVVSIIGILFIGTFGLELYKLWTNKKVSIDKRDLYFFLISIPFNAIWTTSLAVQVAANKHNNFAKYFLVSSVLSAMSCYLLTDAFGVSGAALSTVLQDVILMPVVIYMSLNLLNQSFKSFMYQIENEIISMKSRVSFVLNKIS